MRGRPEEHLPAPGRARQDHPESQHLQEATAGTGKCNHLVKHPHLELYLTLLTFSGGYVPAISHPCPQVPT